MNFLFRRLREEQDGQALYLVAALLVVILGMAALSIDIGYALHGQRELQASADAAAAAGALDLPGSSGNAATDASTAEGDATTAAGDNTPKDLYSVKVATNVVKCWSPCPSGQSANCVPNVTAVPTCNYYDASTKSTVESNNVMIVQETASSPTFFARIFGISSVPLKATAVAMEKGDAPLPIDIMVVVDSTASMQDQDPPTCTRTITTNCVPSGSYAMCSGMTSADWPYSTISTTREDCAKWGVRDFLLGLNNSVQSVGLVTFPAVNPSADGAESDCWSPTWSQGGSSCSPSSKTTGVVPYTCPSADFLIQPLSNTYLNASGALSSSSQLVGSVYWNGPTTCTATTGGNPTIKYGLQDPGGEATRYGEAITEAQSVLAAVTPKVTNAIIVLGDGTVNTGSSPCTAAVTAAQAATSAGTQVFSVGYGIPSGNCGDGGYTYCTLMQDIASVPANFYDDAESVADGCISPHSGLTDLGTIFKGLAERFGTTWMLPSSLYQPGS
jgi:Flp pilus assembly protein TadG